MNSDPLLDWPLWKVGVLSGCAISIVIAISVWFGLQTIDINERWHEWHCHQQHGARMLDMGESHEMCVVDGKMIDEWGER